MVAETKADFMCQPSRPAMLAYDALDRASFELLQVIRRMTESTFCSPLVRSGFTGLKSLVLSWYRAFPKRP